MSIFRRIYRVAKSQLDLSKLSAEGQPAEPETDDLPVDEPSNFRTEESAAPVSPANRYYANLELEPGAEFSDIKAAYRRLLRLYHPDRHAHDPEQARTAEEISKRLNEAMNYFEKEREEGR